MRTLASAADYTSTEALVGEEARIFRRLWIVAGFASTLQAPDAFLTHRIGGTPIVIQNTAQGLRAFVNRCAHRGAPIQLDDFGVRRLACPYHGWTYDGDGRVRSIPGREANYGFDDATMRGLGLAPVALRVVGGMLFVNLAAEPDPLESQFDPAFLAVLGAVSAVAGDDALFARFEAQYNWKLNFENVIDWNHVPFVHAGSFASMMPTMRPAPPGDGARCPPPAPDGEIDDDLRALSYEARVPFDFREWPWHAAVERCGDLREYRNYFLYPNVNYVVMAGAVHLIQQFCPVTPDRTEVRLTMALGRRKQRLSAAAAILWSQLKAEKRVIDEDIAVLEGVQRGIGTGPLPWVHGAYETRLRRAMRVRRRLMAST